MAAPARHGLPSEERQRVLIQRTRELLAVVGSEQFLQAPLLEPTPRFFPRGWAPDVAAASDITRRLLDFSGLGQLELRISEFVNEMPDELEEQPRYVVGFFRGIEASVCDFGIHVPALEDPEYLAGVMAHEVAHAYRSHHGLVRAERDLEEELTDLTTVCLGSGVLTANLADRAVLGETPELRSLRRSQGGYLPVEEFAFLLALQLVARGASAREQRRLENFLGSSQGYCLRHALTRLDELELGQLELHEALGIEKAGTVAYAATEAVSAPLVIERATYPWGKVVYRACFENTRRAAWLGLLLGVLLAIAIARDSGLRAMVAVGAGPLLGMLTARGWVRGYCSNTACGVSIRAQDRECPGCSSYVLGSLRTPPIKFATGVPGSARAKRLVGNRSSSYSIWGGLVGLCFGTMLFGVLDHPGPLFLTPTLGFAFGALLGRQKRRDLCGNRECRTELDDFVHVCPRCLRLVVGEARSEYDTMA